MKRLAFWLTLLTCSTLFGTESVRLRNGSVVVGDVEIRNSGEIVIQTRFPEPSETVLRADDVTPASLYWIEERRADKGDPAERLRLAGLASQASLYGVAIEEYLAAKDLDSGQGKLVDRRVAELTGRIAEDVLDSARDMLRAGQPNSALISLHTILELYPRTTAAKEAKPLMSDAHRQAGAAAEVTKETVPVSRVPQTMEKIEKSLDKGDEARQKVQGHIGSTRFSSVQHRALDRAIRAYLKAWNGARSLPVAVEDEQLKSEIELVRVRAKQKLVTAYLDAASIQLQRGSITDAEGYCNSACELDPEHKQTHETHRLILEAKAYGF